MQTLEEAFRRADLTYYYMDRFEHTDEIGAVLRNKQRISAQITRILGEQNLRPRICKYCGRILPWNYSYGVCSKCFHSRRGKEWYAFDS